MQQQVRAFEPWMISNIATGAATASFLTLLIPPFVTDVTGSAFRVGIVFAAMSLAAVAGPWIGKIADRTGRHRTIYVIAMFAMAGAFALLAVDANNARWSPLFGIILGLSYSAQGTIGPTFIVGAGLTHKQMSGQLTAFSLTYPIGQVIGGLIVAAAQLAGLGTAPIFWIAAATIALLTLVSWPALSRPAARLPAFVATQPDGTVGASADGAADGAPADVPAKRRPVALLATVFGTFLFVVVLSSMGNNGLTSQLANILPSVYGFTAAGTSLLIALAGLLNIGTIVLAGIWMARSTAMTVFAAGTIIRAVGALTMALVGLFTTPVLVLAAVAMLVTYQGTPIPRLAANELAVGLSERSAGQSVGFYFAASAVGSVVGCLVAGVLADAVSFNSVNWFAGAAGLAAALLLVALIPRARTRPRIE